ncbi:MAG: flavodoxin [Myxococcales bacterium]|nr:flavodoxin [Myxococcales bacterium]
MTTLLLVLGSLAAIVIVPALLMTYAIKGGKPGIARPAETFGATGKKVLVAYATKAGSTGEAALLIGRAIAARGAVVDVKPVAEVETIANYEAFVLGTAIRAGQPVPEFLNFIKRHAAGFGGKPVAVFLLCMTLLKDTPENRATVATYFAAVRKRIRPRHEGCFAGRMDYSRLNPLARWAARDLVKVPEGDFRNRDAMEMWANEVFELF